MKYTELYHFSWLSLKSTAVLITDNKKIQDPEQAYILSELVRYLDHDSSGIAALSRMANEWKEVCGAIQQQAVLSKSSPAVERAVISWHQLVRHLALNLSMDIGQPVSLGLSRRRIKDAETNFQENCDQLVNQHTLETEFDIPNAASRVHVLADFLRRTVSFSMKLEAPKDRSRATEVGS